ncbi:SRPBCC domain-containing protein [Phenylobacterium sp.]|uniref:SRPBCC family protein n=1 Tax=Phenylobacterium sp. TaxID=1871053 RepID=UPI0025F76DCC|nr:SRPBCC domain-containing protein [Phenylobacterium sp.]
MAKRQMPTLKRTLEIHAPPTEVWRVLTNPELIREWAAAYQDGISIRTSWRQGEPVTWKAPDGTTQAQGAIAAIEPGRLLKIDYDADARAAFPDTFEIVAKEDRTWLNVSADQLDEDDLKAAEEALLEIKSLAEESAQIRGAR